MSEPTSRTKAKVLVFALAAAASCGVIVYAVVRGMRGRKRWRLAGFSFVLPEWKEKLVMKNPSFGTVELVKADGTAGLVVKWEKQKVSMSIPFQARLVKMIGNNLRYMAGPGCVARPAGNDVPLQVGPHKGRRLKFTLDAPDVHYTASVIIWACSRTDRAVTFGIFDRDSREMELVERRFLKSVDCHASPVFHKERIRLRVQLPPDWREMTSTGSTKTFASGDGRGFLVLGAFAASGEKHVAEDARAYLDYFASRQLSLLLDKQKSRTTYLRTLGHPGAEAEAEVLEKFKPYGSEVRAWLWACPEDKTDYLAVFVGYGRAGRKLVQPVLSTLRCHGEQAMPVKGWKLVSF